MGSAFAGVPVGRNNRLLNDFFGIVPIIDDRQ
jgi:hypothetical protein